MNYKLRVRLYQMRRVSEPRRIWRLYEEMKEVMRGCSIVTSRPAPRIQEVQDHADIVIPLIPVFPKGTGKLTIVKGRSAHTDEEIRVMAEKMYEEMLKLEDIFHPSGNDIPTRFMGTKE